MHDWALNDSLPGQCCHGPWRQNGRLESFPFEYTHGRTVDGTVAHERMRAKLLMHYDVQSTNHHRLITII
jgi:hypothetical protein